MLIKHRPHAALAPFIDSIWFASRGALAHSRERSLPTGCADIVIPLLQDSVVRFDSIDARESVHYRGGIVSGAHDRYVVRGVAGKSTVVGVHFRPGGAAAFLGGALSELRNRTLPLEALWGRAADGLRERLQATPTAAQKLRLLEDALLARLSASARPDALVQQAVRSLEREPCAARVAALQRAAGCSAQQFIRRFDAAVGITPKRFARLLRFNALLRRIVRVGARDWAALAAEGGFYDQSHLIHEFKSFAGMTPAAYAPLHAEQPTHVPVAQTTRAGGAEKSPIPLRLLR